MTDPGHVQDCLHVAPCACTHGHVLGYTTYGDLRGLGRNDVCFNPFDPDDSKGSGLGPGPSLGMGPGLMSGTFTLRSITV